MDPWLSGESALELALLLVIAGLSALETSVLNARRSRLASAASDPRAARAEAILDAPEQFQASAHLAKSLCEALLYATATLLGFELMLHPNRAHLSTLAGLIALAWPGVLGALAAAYFGVTLVGEMLPKSLATRNPERLLMRWAGFIRAFSLVFAPLRWVARQAGRVLAAGTGVDLAQASRAAHSEEEIKLLVEGSAEEGMLEEDEKDMIQSIFEFGDTVARQVMVPRIDIVTVAVDATLEDVVREAMESGHSRLPVHEGTLDNIAGVVHVKDLLPHLVAGQLQAPIRPLLRPPYFVPEGKKIDELLQEFRRHKGQMAIVVDEFGGTSGLVTVEDVLEEIVGEIQDEYDVEEHPAAALAETGGGSLVDARMTIGDVNEQLSLDIPFGDYDTLGGFVFSLFGRPPQPGESARYNGLEFIAEAVEGLRLQKIRVIIHEVPQPGPAED